MKPYSFHPIDYTDYDGVKRRLQKTAEKLSRLEREESAKRLAISLQRRAELRAESFRANKQKKSIVNKVLGMMASERVQLAIAGVILVAVIAWLASLGLSVLKARHVAMLEEMCGYSLMRYVDGGDGVLCYDAHKHVHEMKPDGTTTRTGIDWTVNRRQFKRSNGLATQDGIRWDNDQ
jgi:hypothetical protein